jgi:hypothetical protein
MGDIVKSIATYLPNYRYTPYSQTWVFAPPNIKLLSANPTRVSFTLNPMPNGTRLTPFSAVGGGIGIPASNNAITLSTATHGGVVCEAWYLSALSVHQTMTWSETVWVSSDSEDKVITNPSALYPYFRTNTYTQTLTGAGSIQLVKPNPNRVAIILAQSSGTGVYTPDSVPVATIGIASSTTPLILSFAQVGSVVCSSWYWTWLSGTATAYVIETIWQPPA